MSTFVGLGFWGRASMWVEVSTAYVVDLLVGDPPRVPHPVELMGRAVSGLERLLRRVARSPLSLRLGGVALVILVVAASYLGTLAVVGLAAAWHPLAGVAASVWLISTTVAARGLATAGVAVRRALSAGDLPLARRLVGRMVGRDTERLDESEVSRAAVESVAENTVDGALAPVFYAFLGGAPAAMAYRAVNTLDSMVGYRNERYRDLGWAAARLDDVANYLPARLAIPCLVGAAALVRRASPGGAWRTALRAGRRHPSPNAGWAEAAMAGALGVRLGGLNRYGGVESFRAYLGEGEQPLVPADIDRACRISLLASLIFVIGGMGAATILWAWGG